MAKFEPPRASWDIDYPGRQDWEINALKACAKNVHLDRTALRNGSLAVTFDWELSTGVVVKLEAIYPASFPRFRPHVYLKSPPDPSFTSRHRSPIEGNLCLLGRDSSQWRSSYTLASVLTTQLEGALYGTGGEEDPQGEPDEFWWNSMNPTGGYCLFDSSWDFGDAPSGTLKIAIGDFHIIRTAGQGSKRPTVKAYVAEVRGSDGRVLHQWDSVLPPNLLKAKQIIAVPWERKSGSFMPQNDYSAHIDQLTSEGCSNITQMGTNTAIRLKAFVYPSELSFQEEGLGFTLFMRWTTKNGFKAPKPGKKVAVHHGLPIPTKRAGNVDLGSRAPSIQTLRSANILVVGTGAIGAPIVIELARGQCRKITLVDCDDVEPGNSVRWPLGAPAWGDKKTSALCEFITDHYGATEVESIDLTIGRGDISDEESQSDTEILRDAIALSDIVIDAAASNAVTLILSDLCRKAGKRLISVSATADVKGGYVAMYLPDGACPICLDLHFEDEASQIPPPPGRGDDSKLIQPAGCSERTFSGAGYDLQELSLQATRTVVAALSNESMDAVAAVLDMGHGAEFSAPSWNAFPLGRHGSCKC